MKLPELIVLDVGHGNCAILRDTDAITMIDCPRNAGLIRILRRLDIYTIDNVLISHADVDHAGGLPNLLDKVIVRNIYINPDATKDGKVWNGIQIALDIAEDSKTTVNMSLTTGLSKKICSGQVEIEVLAPSSGVASGGAGGRDPEGRKQYSNSMSVVIGLTHNSHRFALLPGDIDEVGLSNLLKKHKDIEAQVLIFPHHGGMPGSAKGLEFAQQLCGHVKPNLVIFSHGRNHFENPRPEIIQGVASTIPDTHIMCTQLSKNCARDLPISDFSHLTNLPALGRRGANEMCCGGTILIKIDGKETSYAPLRTAHRVFIENKSQVPTPLCLRHLVNL